jgi:uncharacterized lipoprotein YddW (UPF0748 family)
MTRHIPFLSFLTVFFPALLFAGNETYQLAAITPPEPMREFRGAWVATVGNIDWPSKPGLPVAQQKAELISLIDRAAQMKFNAVFLQVRPASDALYSSPIEPWSEFLTGRQGQAPVPFYDPLALAVGEAHKRGLQLHAWFNPFRAGVPESKSPRAFEHITRTHPELVWHYGDQTWLDPGQPAAQARALAVVLDVVKRYDVDGIVLDDYFYPYPETNAVGKTIEFPDDASWKKYGAGSGLNRDDWRRDNVNRFVEKLSQSIKAAKPQVQFGISPFGIWRPKNPPQIKGFDAYKEIYVDSRLWLANGWVDYLAPQLYWPIAKREQSFSVLLNWWRAQNTLDRHVWPALADSSVGGKFSNGEIASQIQLTREQDDPGTVHFHLRTVLENPALADSIRSAYATPALEPPSPWLNLPVQGKPGLVVAHNSRTNLRIAWGSPGGGSARFWVLQFRTGSGDWQTKILPANQTMETFSNPVPDVIAISAVDGAGNLSPTAALKKTPPARNGKSAIILN